MATCIAPKITEALKPYHDVNVGTQSAGKEVIAEMKISIKIWKKTFGTAPNTN